MKNKLTIAAALGTMLFSSLALAPAVHADTYDEKIEEAQQKVSENNQTIHSLEEELNALQKEKSTTEAELASVDQAIAANETKIQELKKALEQSQREMETLLAEIDVLEENIKKRNDKLAEQARTVQTDGDPANYIEFVLASESLTEVFGRMDVVSTLVRANKTLVQEQKTDMELVVEKKEDTEATIEEQHASAAELEVVAAEWEQQKLEKEVLIAQLASEKANVESDRQYYLTQKSEAESMVAEFTAAKEEAEQAAQLAMEQRSQEEAREAVTVAETLQETTETVTSDNSSEAVVVANAANTEGQSSETQQSASKNEEKKAEKKEEPKKETPAPSTSGGTSWGQISSVANSLLGTPYSYGGTTTSGMDCSGFTSYVFRQAGKSLPRSAAGQYAGSTKVSNPRPGDLVFFSGNGRTVTHVGIYTGGGQFIGSQTSTGVAYTSVHGSYWGPKLVGYGRY